MILHGCTHARRSDKEEEEEQKKAKRIERSSDGQDVTIWIMLLGYKKF